MCSSIECVCCACGPSGRLDSPSICFVCVFVCRKLSVVLSGEDVCCSVVVGTLVDVFAFSVMWAELLMASAISCPLWSSVYACHKV